MSDYEKPRRGYAQNEHQQTESLMLAGELDKTEAIRASLQVVAPVIHRYHPLPHPVRIAALIEEVEPGFWKLLAWERAMNGEHAEERLVSRARNRARTREWPAAGPPPHPRTAMPGAGSGASRSRHADREAPR